VCQQAITIKKIKEPLIYINLGTALDELGKKEESIKAYDEGIKIFPMDHLLYYNKAITFQRWEKYQEAVENYQKTLWLNPNHRNSHLRLGYLCADEGKYTQAILSLTTCIMLAPTDSSSLDILNFLNKYLSQKNTLNPKKILLSTGDDFAGLDMIISNRLALNSKYQLKHKLDFPVVRQVQIFLENLSYNPNDNGFWMQFYVPLFVEIMKTDHYETFIYNLFLSSPNEAVTKAVSKNIPKIKNFIQWGSDYWNKSHPFMVLSNNLPVKNYSKGVPAGQIWRTGNHIEAIGNKDETNKNNGIWEYYDTNGNIISKGNYQNGLRQGVWTFYHPNGQKSGEVKFINNEPDGIYAEYNQLGQLIKQTSYRDSVQNGKEISFYPSGDTLSITNYKKGHQDGLYLTFFPIRTKEFAIPYSQDNISGTAHKYFDNEVPEIEVEFKNGEKNGLYKEYYKNRKLYNTESYIAGKVDGPVKYYYANGMIKIEAIAKNGNYINNYKVFYRNGKLMDNYIYDDKGKLNGTYKHYDNDGLPYYEIDYINDNPLAVRYFDKKGNVIFENKKNKNTLAYKGFYPNGRLESEGKYENGNKQGKWKFYEINGILAREENYKDGILNGPYLYYFKNGKTDRGYQYAKGKLNGPYIEYYGNEALYAKGYYIDGHWAGEWEIYQPDGTITSREYYVSGEKHGWQEFFSIDGKLNQETLMDKGKWIKDVLYDSLSNCTETIELNSGTGSYISHYPNRQPLSKNEYINGVHHGKINKFTPLGSLEFEGEYFNDDPHGHWKWYDADKLLSEEGFYFYGSTDSIWKEYYPNKQLKSVRNYIDGEQTGNDLEYYENGNKKQTGHYQDNERHGAFEYYNEQGELMYVLYFYHDDVLGYSYNKAGKLADTLYLNKGNGDVVAYYNNGNKSMECQYRDGWLQGKKINWYPDGHIYSETMFLNGSRHGATKIYYPDGTLKAKEDYFWGRLNGVCNYFYPNGKTSKSLSYRMDKLHGISRYYNQEGKLLKERYCYNGNIYNEPTY
jgi:antitoxin component YwqK of YwqJK toxin-antitoxin module